jgi:uncharacterized cupin superfamily protein
MAEPETLKLPAVDPATVDSRLGSNYPAPHADAVKGREKKPLGDATGLTNFGVNLVRLPAGALSSQRHCHSKQDEFVFVLEGELVLVTDLGEQTLTPGMAAGFPAGAGDGHHLVNRTDADAVYLEIGDRTEGDEVDYPDIDMLIRHIDGKRTYIHRDGTPYK